MSASIDRNRRGRKRNRIPPRTVRSANSSRSDKAAATPLLLPTALPSAAARNAPTRSAAELNDRARLMPPASARTPSRGSDQARAGRIMATAATPNLFRPANLRMVMNHPFEERRSRPVRRHATSGPRRQRPGRRGAPRHFKRCHSSRGLRPPEKKAGLPDPRQPRRERKKFRRPRPAAASVLERRRGRGLVPRRAATISPRRPPTLPAGVASRHARHSRAAYPSACAA